MPKKWFKLSFLLSGLAVVSVSVSSCGFFSFSDFDPGSLPSVNTQKIVTEIPNQNYQKIHDLSFSFEFNNTGGYNPSRHLANPEQNLSQAYQVYGTGWLFDWQKPDADLNDQRATWTGYFATNLHVAEALLNPWDNEKYRPSWYDRVPNSEWLKMPNESDRMDHTLYFNLGKWTNDSDDRIENKKMSYLPISNLPKTVYTATNFFKEEYKPNWLGEIERNNPNIREYVDFAVISITLDLSYSFDIFGNKKYNQQREYEIYNKWIVPAKEIIKSSWSNDHLESENDHKQKATLKTGLFDRTDYTSAENDLSKMRVFLGGYPYYAGWTRPRYLKNTVRSQVGDYQYRNYGISVNTNGSPGWTINASKLSNDIAGQPLNTDSIISANSGIRRGIYNASNATNFMLVYRNTKYKQYGYGYVIENSNLSAGSSGSMALTKQDKVLGIYFGTLATSKEQEATFGLVAALYNPSQISVTTRTNDGIENSRILPYDLIFGNNIMSDRYGSYRSSIRTLNLNTQMFDLVDNFHHPIQEDEEPINDWA
ncbi:MIP family Ig-specific serine endopeptidase [Mycoplasma sp. E35C]|uniref:MIP family Ig-specific serine endopeptidase n=1 Tax=Mycoplasma sp. E35C TaxID=2801918 RepID=UPI001CA3F522|nr:DUF31 family protein [Mycoplasma sp. E35C]QZX49384.1 DUF31 family protein [Mycoplasma sp. E35C]